MGENWLIMERVVDWDQPFILLLELDNISSIGAWVILVMCLMPDLGSRFRF